MKDANNFLIHKNATVREALKLIDSNSMQVALVVDDKKKLIGTLTDGDIRRGLLNGLTLEDSIKNIVNLNPMIAKLSDSKEEVVRRALARKLRFIPVIDDLGQVLGLREIDELISPKLKKNKVVLMTGGLGSRLHPLTLELPKPLLKVGDKPILQTIVERFADYGFVDFLMCVNYKAGMIEDYFGDGSNFGLKIEYVREIDRMGTAGALALLQETPVEPFIVMNGDLLTNVNFENLLDFHNTHNSDATMCVRDCSFQIPYGVVSLNGSQILEINEKPVQKFFVSAGIYVLNPSALNLIPKNTFFDMPTLFEKLIADKNNVISFPIHEYWLDIGRISEYEKANRDYQEVFGV